MPKLHFLDTGLACWLLGIRTVEQLRSHPLRGALFESWVVAEAYKALLNRGEPHRLCFYRSRDGAEADLLIDHPSGLKLLEAKAGATPAANLFDGARRVQRQLGEQATCQLAVVYGGRGGADALHWPDHSLGQAPSGGLAAGPTRATPMWLRPCGVPA